MAPTGTDVGAQGVPSTAPDASLETSPQNVGTDGQAPQTPVVVVTILAVLVVGGVVLARGPCTTKKSADSAGQPAGVDGSSSIYSGDTSDVA